MPRLLAALALSTSIAPAAGEPAGPEPTLLHVNGAALHYVEHGSGTPVVFVHGGLEDFRAWMPHLEAFAERHRTVAYSRRHNHPNPRVEPRPDYSAAVDAEDLGALIRELGLAPAHVVGVSYGAYASLLLAARHPELVRSLVLAEPPLLRWLPELEGGSELFAEFEAKLWTPATAAFRESDAAGVRAAIDGFGALADTGSGPPFTFSALPPEVREFLLGNAHEWRALTASSDAFPPLSEDAVRDIRAPTLLLSGAHSLALHAAIDARLAQLLPDARRVVIPDATHEMWSEQPERCRREALAFLAEH